MGVRSVAEARKDDDNYFPLDKEYAISFEKAVSFVTPCLDDFDEYIRKEAKDLALPVYEEENSCDMFGENDFETFCDDNAPFHQIGGLPFFRAMFGVRATCFCSRWTAKWATARTERARAGKSFGEIAELRTSF